jgi:hypothetical protein
MPIAQLGRADVLSSLSGFVHEGLRRRAAVDPSDGAYKDTMHLAMLDTDWVMRSVRAAHTKSLWDEMLDRHGREREALVRWEETCGRSVKRVSSTETIKDYKPKNENTAASPLGKGKGKGKGKTTEQPGPSANSSWRQLRKDAKLAEGITSPNTQRDPGGGDLRSWLDGVAAQQTGESQTTYQGKRKARLEDDPDTDGDENAVEAARRTRRSGFSPQRFVASPTPPPISDAEMSDTSSEPGSDDLYESASDESSVYAEHGRDAESDGLHTTLALLRAQVEAESTEAIVAAAQRAPSAGPSLGVLAADPFSDGDGSSASSAENRSMRSESPIPTDSEGHWDMFETSSVSSASLQSTSDSDAELL